MEEINLIEIIFLSILLAALLAAAVWKLIANTIEVVRRHNYERKNKREWDAYWSGQGTFGHCGQNIKCHCKTGMRPTGPVDVSYFFSNEQADERDRILERYRRACGGSDK